MKVIEAIQTVNTETQVYSIVKKEGGLLSLNGCNMTDELNNAEVFKVEVIDRFKKEWHKDIVVIRIDN